MTDAQIKTLEEAGIKIHFGMHTNVVLSEDENNYCMRAIELGKPNNPELVRRYAVVAKKHGLPPLPDGFRYGSGSSRQLNVFTETV